MTIGALEQFLDAAQLTSFERVIVAADHVVDLGPGAGEHGVELMFLRPNRKAVARSHLADRPLPAG